MLLNKNKKTVFHRNTRFDANRFKRQLSEARGYKRSGATYGSISRWRTVKVTAPLVVAAGLIAYLFFVPNIFFVKTIIVHGSSEELGSQTRNTVDQFLHTKKMGLFSQRNLLLLNEGKLTEHIVSRQQSVYQIAEIKKAWFKRALEVTVVPREEVFLLEAGGSLYTVSLDGRVYRQVDSGQPAPAGLLKIIGDPEQRAHIGQNIFTDSALESLKVIKSELHAGTSLGAEFIDLSLAEEYIIGNKKYVSGGVGEFVVKVLPNEQKKTPAFFIFFDANSDVSHTLVKLQALLDSFSQDRLKNLAYIDMRFKNRGFVCLKNAPCVRAPIPPPPPAEAPTPTTH